MKRTHRAFWAAGWAGMAIGVLLVIAGISAPSEVAALAGGYGLMVIGAAAYLLAGLKLRDRHIRRQLSSATVAAMSGTTAASARS
jgi:hypothetical protein